jgi:hypothetical protein
LFRAERCAIDATERWAMDAIPLKKMVGNLGALTNKFIEFKKVHFVVLKHLNFYSASRFLIVYSCLPQKESAVIAKTSKMSGHLFLANHLLNLREQVIHVYLTSTPI